MEVNGRKQGQRRTDDLWYQLTESLLGNRTSNWEFRRYVVRVECEGTGETARWLGSLTALLEDLS